MLLDQLLPAVCAVSTGAAARLQLGAASLATSATGAGAFPAGAGA